MAEEVTHDLELVAGEETVLLQSDLQRGRLAKVKLGNNNNELTVRQLKVVLNLVTCLGEVGHEFGGTPITSLAVGLTPA